MPVSSPSYFPPNRANGTVVGLNAGQSTTGSRNFLAGKASGQYTNISDLIVIGDSAFSAGTSASHITDTNLAGSIAIGTNAASALIGTNAGGSNPAEAVTVIGYNSLAKSTYGGGNCVIGWNILPAVNTGISNPQRNLTCIGTNIALGASWQALRECVLIGNDIATTANNSNLITCVIIGHAAGNVAGSNSTTSCVFIGEQAATAFTGGTNNVVVGASAATGATSFSDMVAVGAGVLLPGSTASQSVVIGSQARANSGSNNVFIGYGSNSANSVYSNKLLLEVTGQGALVFGDFSNGNLVMGASVEGTNRDFGGAGATNIVKHLNGTKGASNPVGGGYFYVNAGALHWVGSSGTDTQIAPA